MNDIKTIFYFDLDNVAVKNSPGHENNLDNLEPNPKTVEIMKTLETIPHIQVRIITAVNTECSSRGISLLCWTIEQNIPPIVVLESNEIYVPNGYVTDDTKQVLISKDIKTLERFLRDRRDTDAVYYPTDNTQDDAAAWPGLTILPSDSIQEITSILMSVVSHT